MQLCRCFPAFATYTLELVLFDVYCTLVLLLLPAACVLSESSHHLVPHPPSLFLFPVPQTGLRYLFSPSFYMCPDDCVKAAS